MFKFFTKKAEVQSGLRFCQKPSELPYHHLFEAGALTLAISRISSRRVYPDDSFGYDVSARGVVHAPGGLLRDGSQEPLLPFQLSFREHSRYHLEGHLGGGNCSLVSQSNHPHFQLSLAIGDPDGLIWKSLERAFANSVVSGADFLHLRCWRAEETLETQANRKYDDTTALAAGRAREDALDAGELDLPEVVFDGLAFEDELVTKAKSWSWAWADQDVGLPGFHSKGTQMYRANMLRWRDL